jgi:hypothetical protein
MTIRLNPNTNPALTYLTGPDTNKVELRSPYAYMYMYACDNWTP